MVRALFVFGSSVAALTALGCLDVIVVVPGPEPAASGDAGVVVVDSVDAGVDPGDAGEPDAGAVDAGPAPVTACYGSYASFVATGTMKDEDVVEASGIAASLVTADVVWVHNDSGDASRLFALGVDGSARARLTISAPLTDHEDVAAARCPDGGAACLWIADTGNKRLRSRGPRARRRARARCARRGDGRRCALGAAARVP